MVVLVLFYFYFYFLFIQGTFNGDLGKIIDGTVDTLMDTFTMTAQRSRVFDLTVPFIKPTLSFLTTPKPLQLASLHKLFGAFNWRVWILIAIVLCILSLVGRLMNLFQEKSKDNDDRIKLSNVIHALTVDTEHADSIRPSTVTQTTFIVLYIIAVTTFTAAYQGALLQTLLVNDAYIYSVDELIQQISNGERQLVIESAGYYFTDEIEYARVRNDTTDMTLFARLARATEKSPIIENANGTLVLEGVAKNKYIYMQITHEMEDMLKISNYRSYEQCDVFDLIVADDGSEHWLGMRIIIIISLICCIIF